VEVDSNMKWWYSWQVYSLSKKMFDEKGEGEGELVNFGICGLLFLGLVALIPLYTKSTALSNLKGYPLFT
jgi:hypothetical protein